MAGGSTAAGKPEGTPGNSKDHVPLVEDTPKSPSKVHRAVRAVTFTLMDIVEDGVRVRVLNIFAFLLVYIFFVFGFLKISQGVAPQVTKVEVSTPMPRATFSGKYDKELVTSQSYPIVTPAVAIFDQHGNAVEGATAKVKIVDFSPTGPLPCSVGEQLAMRDTLRHLQYKDVCDFTVAEGMDSDGADKTGVAVFADMTLNGPAGIYTLQVESQGKSAPIAQKVTIQTMVAEMWVVDPTNAQYALDAPEEVKIGVKLDPQPAILLMDANGLPVANRRVKAFAHADPTWPPTGPMVTSPPTWGVQGQKFAELDCATSELSGADGIARFTCLKVVGSTADHVYFVFSESGVVFKPWNDPTDTPRSLYPIPVAHFKYPTWLGSPVDSVEPTTAAYTTVQVAEGSKLDPPPKVIAKDASDQPVAGVWCYATVAASQGRYLPANFRRQEQGVVNKELLNAKAMTDASGVATFSDLTLSSYGNVLDEDTLRADSESSIYIGFVCDGLYPETTIPWDDASGGFIKQVKSKVASIAIQRFTSTAADAMPYHRIEQAAAGEMFTAVVRVLDQDGNGVAGKSVTVMPLHYTSDFVVKNMPSANEPTTENGFAVVSFAAILAPGAAKEDGSATIRVKFVVDGIASPLSQELTVRLADPGDTQLCHMVGITQVKSFDGATEITKVKDDVPYVFSGQSFQVWLTLHGQTVDSCTYTTGGDVSQCTAFGAGRRLSGVTGEDELHDTLHAEGVRRLRAGEAPVTKQRRLATSLDGSVSVSMQAAYSDVGTKLCDSEGECTLKVPLEPDHLLQIKALDTIRPPSSTDLLANPRPFPVSAMVMGSMGDHFLRFRASYKNSAGEEQTCETPPMQLRVLNWLYDLEVAGDVEDNYFGKVVQAAEAIPIKLTLTVLDLDTFQPTSAAGIAQQKLATTWYQENAIYWKWVQIPRQWAYLFPTDEETVPDADHQFYSIIEVDAAGNPGTGWDGATGSLHLQLKMKKAGLFGDFAIQFGSRGVWSRVFTFNVKQPEDIAVVVVTPPGHNVSSAGTVPTQTYFDTQPVVKITAGGVPLEGAVVAAVIVPEDGGEFQRLTDLELYSPLPLIYSDPSGADGIANFYFFGVLDGLGCAKFRFVLVPDEVQSELTPDEPLCFKSPYEMKIVSQPPSSLPLGMPLRDVSGSAPIVVEATTKIIPSLLCPEDNTGFEEECPKIGFNFFVLRVLISEAGGKKLNREEAKAASRLNLEDQVCVFIGGKEILNRCTALEYVQWSPYLVIRTKIAGLRWTSIPAYPAEVKLMISDLSGSPYGVKLPSPADFGALSGPEQVSTCANAVLQAAELRQLTQTKAIQAELVTASTSVVLPPPELVVVGKIFLVRVRLLTKQGGPVAGKAMRVCIAKSASLDPAQASPSLLQKLSVTGFDSSNACGKDATLSPVGIVRVSDKAGVVSFPLTVDAAPSGTYLLHFQPEEPGAKIQASTASFRVFNPIEAVSSAGAQWSTLEVEKFGEVIRVPKKPVFRVTVSTGETLAQLEAQGLRVKVGMLLRGVSKKRLETQRKLLEYRRKAAQEAAKVATKKSAEVLAAAAKASGDLVASTADLQAEVSEATASKASAFSMLQDEFAEACAGTAAAALAAGDPATGSTEEVQEPSMSDEVALDPSVVPAEQLFGQFVGALTGGGAEMQSVEEMQPIMELELGYNALEPYTADGQPDTYTVKDELLMNFQPEFQYQLVLHVNGVKGKDTDFTPFEVVQQPVPAVDIAVEWFVSMLALILAAIALISNTRKHHKAWLLIAWASTLAVLIAVPFLKNKKDALGGHWAVLACINLVFMLGALTYGLLCELMPNRKLFVPFEEKRRTIFWEYSRRRVVELIAAVERPRPSLKENVIGLVKPFSIQTAFYFPSNMLTASFIALCSFVYILIRIIDIKKGIDEALNAMKARAVSALLRKLSSMNEQFYSATGRDLPDQAMNFMYKQLEVMTGWFDDVVTSLETCITVGIVFAVLFTFGGMCISFYDFRRRSLGIRVGEGLGAKVQVAHSAAFIGAFISSTIIGFVCIVFLVALIMLPFMWPLLWDLLWSYRVTIILLIIPALISPLLTFVFKFFAFGPDFYKSRAIAAAFVFWQTYISLAGGVIASIVRFIIGVVGVLLMLPTICGPVTPPLLNRVVLLDALHRAYLSAVFTHNLLNNPILATAAHRLMIIKDTRLAFQAKGNRWTSKKSLLILLLLRFPHLKKLRKHALAAQREAAEAAKGKKGIALAVGPGKGSAKVQPVPETLGKEAKDSMDKE